MICVKIAIKDNKKKRYVFPHPPRLLDRPKTPACLGLNFHSRTVCKKPTNFLKNNHTLIWWQAFKIYRNYSYLYVVFKNAGIYLLDDPMSAIDPCLRLRIFDQVFGNRGLLRKKTRIIITKDQRFLSKLDYIIVMKNKVSSWERYGENG